MTTLHATFEEYAEIRKKIPPTPKENTSDGSVVPMSEVRHIVEVALKAQRAIFEKEQKKAMESLHEQIVASVTGSIMNVLGGHASEWLES